jgi:hypothetical protein
MNENEVSSDPSNEVPVNHPPVYETVSSMSLL